ncbi:outer membrane lipid asymmetry maintenance protein MlaD [Acidocella sp.]|uniref:outer membrane lipid asymmetry maintenance protein MlaD n=1 Tax=Acidocella sp. TaxID=50710 RepID=UPI002632216A|nr:outer membrane lipid asymmetry maintenance protein MlaD [Acidocella sp.]
MSRRLPELLTGFAVIVTAVSFLIYAMLGAGQISTGGYPLQAQFASIGGLTVGADVKIGGVVIGHVASERLDPNTYEAIIRLAINNDIKVPEDSSASVTSDGLLGGSYVAVAPGGSNTMLAPGQTFSVTQSAINIQDLLGKFIFSMGSGSSSKPAQSSAPAVGPSSGNPAALK